MMRKAFCDLAIFCFFGPVAAQSVPSFSPHLLQQAQSGDDAAQRALAYDYFYGRGTSKNLPAAAQWYKISADHGNPSSAANFAEIEASPKLHTAATDSNQLALTYFTKAADGGYTPAYVGLGNFYANQKDFAEAANWYRKAVEQNNVVAEFELGRLYLYGKGVPKNQQQGKFLLRKAARQGSLAAKNMLEANVDNRDYGFPAMTPMIGPGPNE